MGTPIVTHPTTNRQLRAAVEARLAAARALRGRAYTAEQRNHAILEYLDALKDAVTLDLAEAFGGDE